MTRKEMDLRIKQFRRQNAMWTVREGDLIEALIARAEAAEKSRGLEAMVVEAALRWWAEGMTGEISVALRSACDRLMGFRGQQQGTK